MVKINIRDTNFGGEQSSCHRSSNKHVEWVFNNVLVSKTCFMTDACLLDVYKASGVKRKVAWLLEPRAVNPNIYAWIKLNNKLFDFVLTYDLDLVEKGENYIYYPHGMCWINPTHKDAFNKIKNCSIIASSKNFTKGHNLRHQVILQKYEHVDVFGSGYKFIDNKQEALNSYMFSITIENSIQRGYFTEKIIDCFATKTIPIYWGDTHVNKYFDESGIMRFSDLKDLENILNNIKMNGKEIYKKMQPAIEYNYSKFELYRTPEDWIYNNYSFLFN